MIAGLDDLWFDIRLHWHRWTGGTTGVMRWYARLSVEEVIRGAVEDGDRVQLLALADPQVPLDRVIGEALPVLAGQLDTGDVRVLREECRRVLAQERQRILARADAMQAGGSATGADARDGRR